MFAGHTLWGPPAQLPLLAPGLWAGCSSSFCALPAVAPHPRLVPSPCTRTTAHALTLSLTHISHHHHHHHHCAAARGEARPGGGHGSGAAEEGGAGHRWGGRLQCISSAPHHRAALHLHQPCGLGTLCSTPAVIVCMPARATAPPAARQAVLLLTRLPLASGYRHHSHRHSSPPPLHPPQRTLRPCWGRVPTAPMSCATLTSSGAGSRVTMEAAATHRCVAAPLPACLAVGCEVLGCRECRGCHSQA
jgi:hypothetical protein